MDLQEIKNNITELGTKINDNLAAKYVQKDALKAEHERVNNLEVELKKMRDGGSLSFGGKPSIKKAFQKDIFDTPDFQAFMTKQTRDVTFKLKAAGTMLESSSLTGDVVDDNRLPGVAALPLNKKHIRDFLPKVSAGPSDRVTWTELTGGEGSATAVAEGSVKPLKDYDYSQITRDFIKVASRFKVSEEFLKDLPWAMNFISTRGTQDLLTVEDYMLLYGPGTTGTLEGLTVSATAYTDALNLGSTATPMDVIMAAATSLKGANYMTNGIIMAPSTAATLMYSKGSDGHYIIPSLFGSAPMTIGGIPIQVNTSLEDGEVLLGDFTSSRLVQREGISVRFYEQDEDNVSKNLVTVVIEQRLALVNFNSGAGYIWIEDLGASTTAAKT